MNNKLIFETECETIIAITYSQDKGFYVTFSNKNDDTNESVLFEQFGAYDFNEVLNRIKIIANDFNINLR